jgi:hypothetical protein
MSKLSKKNFSMTVYKIYFGDADEATLRGQIGMEIRETYCNKGVLDISSQSQLYWLNLAYVVPKSHPFRCKYDIDWKKVYRIKISNYSKQQAFGWRSTHGKLYGNKDFFRFGVKQSGKCGYCDNPRQSAEHLFTECTYLQRLFACFECKFKLNEKLSELEKLIGIDPSIERSLITIKCLSILRKQLYDFNHQDIKLRWEMFFNRVDEIYVIEYAIADRSDKLPLHLKIWDSHD